MMLKACRFECLAAPGGLPNGAIMASWRLGPLFLTSNSAYDIHVTMKAANKFNLATTWVNIRAPILPLQRHVSSRP